MQEKSIKPKQPRPEGLFVNIPKKGVVIFVPSQRDLSIKMKLDLRTSPVEMLSSFGGFTFLREVINFKIVDQDYNEIPSFNPPIELTVLFKNEEYELALSKGKEITLAYRVKEGEDWFPFGLDHDLRVELINDPIWAGLFKVNISKWGDPSVSTGH